MLFDMYVQGLQSTDSKGAMIGKLYERMRRYAPAAVLLLGLPACFLGVLPVALWLSLMCDYTCTLKLGDEVGVR